MCLGFSRYFSTYSLPEPKLIVDSFLEDRKASFSCSEDLTILRPRPPPPSAAFRITGYPILSVISKALLSFETSYPSTTGETFEAILLAITLSPVILITLLDGPTKIRPSFLQLSVNFRFLERNP